MRPRVKSSISNCNLQFSEDHTHHGIRPNLHEEADSIWQLLFAVLLVSVGRCNPHPLVIHTEAVEEELVLELMFVAH